MILCYILLYDCLFLLENDQNIQVLCLRREGISRFREVFSIARDVNILGGISILVLSSCALCTRVASAAAHLPKTAFKVKQAKTRGETISSKSRDEHKQNKLHEKG
jgi:hypothetical protein